ncbi:DUF2147 domain-containing protein [Pseudorhodobacter aquimaris]|uniref:DUF2147 domain-containing protein n=1 Tax=Pseudorhodobacter aquimaris TaxID=687412 RepID=UPI00067BFE8D|nr:DUF2147 domain-containing protein [Pseudorhodobacter aquimaris]
MKQLILAAALICGAGMAQADPVLGIWKTQADEGAFAHVKIATCGTKLCGVITRTFTDKGEYKSPNIGKRLLWDMSPNGGGAYSGGRIWQPSTGKEYKSKMTLAGDILNVAGCFGPICKKQVWARVK